MTEDFQDLFPNLDMAKGEPVVVSTPITLDSIRRTYTQRLDYAEIELRKMSMQQVFEASVDLTGERLEFLAVTGSAAADAVRDMNRYFEAEMAKALGLRPMNFTKPADITTMTYEEFVAKQEAYMKNKIAIPASVLALSGAAIASLSSGTSLDMAEAPVETVFEEDSAETPPDRLSVDKRSPFYNSCYKRTAVYVDNVKRDNDVQEYCMSEGWVDVRQRNPITDQWRMSEDGTYLTQRIHGRVEATFTRQAHRETPAAPQDHEGHLRRAAEKRARKAAKAAR